MGCANENEGTNKNGVSRQANPAMVAYLVKASVFS